MKAFNRVNPHGLRFMLQEDEHSSTHICTVGDKVDFIHVKIRIDDIILAWDRWKAGERIQIAFPFLTAYEREFIKTGITSEEWDAIFSGDEV